MQEYVKKLSLSSIENACIMKFVVVFTWALVLRAVLELLSGSYPVGLDALSGYVPAVLALPDISPTKGFGWAYSPLAIYLLGFTLLHARTPQVIKSTAKIKRDD